MDENLSTRMVNSSFAAAAYTGHARTPSGAMFTDLDDAVLVDREPCCGSVARPEHSSSATEHSPHHAEPSPSYRDEYLETLKLLVAGGVAGAVSKTCTAPLARLTILLQVRGLHATTSAGGALSANLGTVAALQHIMREEGVRALWKGNGITIVHRLPYSSVNFWAYEQVNEWWKQHLPASFTAGLGPVEPILRRLVAGGTAGLTACTVAYPLDLVRTLLAAQTGRQQQRSVGEVLGGIVRVEGVRGLYRGLGPTLMQVGPSLAVNYAAYETVRSYWLAHTDRTTPTVGMSLACGSIAGLVSSSVTFPLDLVRRRMQLQGQGGTAVVYSSFGHALRSIAAREGVRGLYSGILPEYYKVVPGVAIAFMTYEFMKRSLKVQTNVTGR